MTAKNGSRPKPPTTEQPDWQAEAQFWQLKYFEQLIHSTQIIAALNRPMLAGVQQLQAEAAAAMAAQGVPPQ